MLLELYIMYSIIAFTAFFIALYFNKGFNNIFVWPIVILMFSMLIFASYDIITQTFSIAIPELFWLNMAMAGLSFILFGWDLFDKFTSGELF